MMSCYVRVRLRWTMTCDITVSEGDDTIITRAEIEGKSYLGGISI